MPIQTCDEYFLSMTDEKKSLGKLFMSVTSLVLSVSSCYKMFKRAALRYGDLAFIYLSLLTQVSARIIAIWVLFSSQQG